MGEIAVWRDSTTIAAQMPSIAPLSVAAGPRDRHGNNHGIWWRGPALASPTDCPTNLRRGIPHFPGVEALVRRVQRVAANRPDPLYVLAQTIGMTGTIGMDPCAVLGVLVEGAVQTLIEQIPAEQQAEATARLIELLRERLTAHGLPGSEDKDRRSVFSHRVHLYPATPPHIEVLNFDGIAGCVTCSSEAYYTFRSHSR
jgi:hypothetical protein